LEVTPHKEYERTRHAVLEHREGLAVGLAVVVVATVERALH
jgi:regulator of sirC expression with transglutaminase-like and TPR domain